MLILRIRFICIGLFLFASAGFGATGEYQQTKDGKTTVWNGSPKAGESASWAGARDKEGYAIGFGTITWYTDQGTVYAMYYGNMVRGKLEGPVNAHSRRKTAHAYFADGGRVTEWARGPAPSHPEPNWPLRARAVEQPKTEENEPRAEVASETKAKKPKPDERQRDIATETKLRPKPEPKKIRPIEHVAKTTEEKEPLPPPQPTAQPSESRETAEHSSEEAPKSPPAVAQMHTAPTPESTQSTSSLFEPPKIAESQEPSTPVETPRVPIPETSVEQKAETAEQPATVEPTAKSGTDASLSALTGPPSSLRSGSIRESPAPSRSATTSRSTSSGTRGVAQLTEDEAIGLADIEARARGYDLNEYQRPKADYSAVKDKWSLFYNLKDPKAADGDLQPFSVTVGDKTKNVEIRRNY
jgi:hypothetical protein